MVSWGNCNYATCKQLQVFVDRTTKTHDIRWYQKKTYLIMQLDKRVLNKTDHVTGIYFVRWHGYYWQKNNNKMLSHICWDEMKSWQWAPGALQGLEFRHNTHPNGLVKRAGRQQTLLKKEGKGKGGWYIGLGIFVLSVVVAHIMSTHDQWTVPIPLPSLNQQLLNWTAAHACMCDACVCVSVHVCAPVHACVCLKHRDVTTIFVFKQSILCTKHTVIHT